ncbi:MAG: hypothetical protein JWP94_1692 [Mucilaginibacter sp.]|jgi:hypothetical protein|nr:hypothetical protein [Mucilaginibacter sp.]
MKIYSVRPDSNNVQWVIPIVPEENILSVLSFDCITKKNGFDNIEWYIFNPKERKGNFYTGVNGALIFDQEVYDSDLSILFEMAGEILPIKLENGEILYALNVLECVNMLNQKETTYDIYDSGKRGRILNYSFHPDRLSESSIFKIPETSRVEILTYTDVKYPDDEFYTVYKESGFTGLVFEEIWG